MRAQYTNKSLDPLVRSEDVVASGVLSLYHHVKGAWAPVKGDANSKSNATLVKSKTGSYTIKVLFNATNEVRLFPLSHHFALTHDPY